MATQHGNGGPPTFNTSAVADGQLMQHTDESGQVVLPAMSPIKDCKADGGILEGFGSESARGLNKSLSSCADEDEIVFAGCQDVDWVDRYWGPTRHISIDALNSLVKRHAAVIHGSFHAGTCALVASRHGVYNTAYILRFENGTKICVRVPAAGWGERWNEKDQKLLRSTALAMRLINKKTALPLPKVLAYDTSMNNEIGAPFMLMTCVEGMSARQAWNSEEGSIPKESRRQNLLRSLATAISELRNLKFPRSGSLWFNHDDDDGPFIGESWNLRVEGYVIKRTFERVDPYSSTRCKVMESLQLFLDAEGFPDNCHNTTMKGILTLYRKMVEVFLDAAEFPEADENFVLMHSDFDIQNLLVDEEGNLTGILDWDGVSSQPRQAGWSMMPFWLQHDWSSSYHWPPAVGANFAMLRPEDFHGYRQDYARYLWEACKGVGDCRYTSKSHLYRVLLNSIGDRFEAGRFVQNTLADLLPRGRGMLYCKQIGEYGFREGEKEWFEASLRHFFEPTEPRKLDLGREADSGTLSSIGELELRRWTFDHDDVRVRDILQLFALLVRSLLDFMLAGIFFTFEAWRNKGREKL